MKHSLNFITLKSKVSGIVPGVETHLKRSLDVKVRGVLESTNSFQNAGTIVTRITQKAGELLRLKVIKTALHDSLVGNVATCIDLVGTHRYYSYPAGDLAEYLLRSYKPSRLFFWACNTGQGAVTALKDAITVALGNDGALRAAMPDRIDLFGPGTFMNQMSIKALLIPFVKAESSVHGLEYSTHVAVR